LLNPSNILRNKDKYKMTNKRLTLFPDYDEWSKEIFTSTFVNLCHNHMASLGYYSHIIKDQICIVDSTGSSSCTPGTLVGWRFVSEIEKFIANNGYPWFGDDSRTQVESSKGFAIVGQFANIVSELLQREPEIIENEKNETI